MKTASTEREAIVAWLRADSREKHRIALECWAESRKTGDTGDGAIGDSIFHEHQVQDRIADAIARGDHLRGAQ